MVGGGWGVGSLRLTAVQIAGEVLNWGDIQGFTIVGELVVESTCLFGDFFPIVLGSSEAHLEIRAHLGRKFCLSCVKKFRMAR